MLDDSLFNHIFPWTHGTLLLNVGPELCSPNSYVEALIPKVTVFGIKAFREVIKAKCGHKGDVLIC